MISFLLRGLSRALINFQTFVNFLVISLLFILLLFLSLLICSLFLLWTVHAFNILALENFLRLDLWTRIWTTLVNVVSVLGKNEYLQLLVVVFYKSQLDQFRKVYNSNHVIIFIIFCLLFLPVTWTGTLISSIM